MAPTGVTSRPARGAQPTEQFLQQVWQYQSISRGTLRTKDGRRVAVLHPGFINHEAGPNFRRAFIQIGRAAPIECHLEIDLVSEGWRLHGHNTNPAFSGSDCTSSGRPASTGRLSCRWLN